MLIENKSFSLLAIFCYTSYHGSLIHLLQIGCASFAAFYNTTARFWPNVFL
jgi:hypothetical protein